MKLVLILISSVFIFSNVSFGERYFAKIKANSTVETVIVADSIEDCERLLGGRWIETLLDSPDKNYAGKGHDYYEIYKDFVAPTPFVSWVLDEKRKWKAPIDMPADDKKYEWNEDILNWESTLAP